MAASDKPFRSQRSLDIVFAISNILMLLSVVWMMWADYAREYKTKGRIFRDLEVSMAQQQALQLVPSKAEFDTAKDEVEKFSKIRNSDANKEKLAKAKVDSITSFLYIAREQGDGDSAKKYEETLKDLHETLGKEQAKRDEITN